MTLSTGMRDLTDLELLSVSGGFAGDEPEKKVIVRKRIEAGCEITETCEKDLKTGAEKCTETRKCGMKIIIDF